MIFIFLNRPIFTPIFTNDYYQVCLIKSMGSKDLHFHFIIQLDIISLGLDMPIIMH